MKTVKLTEYHKQMIWVALAVSLMIILGVFAVILPDVKKLGYLQRDLDQVSARQDVLRDILKQEKALKAIGSLVTPEKDRYLVMSQVTALANRHKLEIETITPVSDLGEGLFRPYQVQLNLRGSFVELMPFLQGVAEMKPVVSVNKILISQGGFSRQENSSTTPLQISILMSALIQDGGAKNALGAEGI